MNKEQYLLIKLAEECNEVAQIALKAAQFGLDNIKPEQLLTNRERLNSEIGDIIVIIALLDGNDSFHLDEESDEILFAKKAKVEKYLGVSMTLGKVQNV